MTRVEKINMAIAVAAIVTSVATFWISQFYHSDRLKVRVQYNGIEQGRAQQTITLVNTGTRHVTLLRLYGTLSDDLSFEAQEHTERVAETLLIPPDQMVTIKAVNRVFHRGRPESPEHVYYGGYVFQVMDMDGQVHSALLPQMAIRARDNKGGYQVAAADGLLDLLVGTDREVVIDREIEIPDDWPVQLSHAQ